MSGKSRRRRQRRLRPAKSRPCPSCEHGHCAAGIHCQRLCGTTVGLLHPARVACEHEPLRLPRAGAAGGWPPICRRSRNCPAGLLPRRGLTASPRLFILAASYRWHLAPGAHCGRVPGRAPSLTGHVIPPTCAQLGPAGCPARRRTGHPGPAPPARRGVQLRAAGRCHLAVCSRPAGAGPSVSRCPPPTLWSTSSASTGPLAGTAAGLVPFWCRSAARIPLLGTSQPDAPASLGPPHPSTPSAPVPSPRCSAGDKVSLFSENSGRWLVADQAVMKCGAADAVRGPAASAAAQGTLCALRRRLRRLAGPVAVPRWRRGQPGLAPCGHWCPRWRCRPHRWCEPSDPCRCRLQVRGTTSSFEELQYILQHRRAPAAPARPGAGRPGCAALHARPCARPSARAVSDRNAQRCSLSSSQRSAAELAWQDCWQRGTARQPMAALVGRGPARANRRGLPCAPPLHAAAKAPRWWCRMLLPWTRCCLRWQWTTRR